MNGQSFSITRDTARDLAAALARTGPRGVAFAAAYLGLSGQEVADLIMLVETVEGFSADQIGGEQRVVYHWNAAIARAWAEVGPEGAAAVYVVEGGDVLRAQRWYTVRRVELAAVSEAAAR